MLLYEWRKRPEVLWAAACCGGTWLLYSVASNNSSGLCLSIRWFVPLLAPAYYLLAMWLHKHPRYWMLFGLLSAWGFLLMVGTGDGPWSSRVLPGFWLIQGGAILTWGGLHLYQHRRQAAPAAADAEQSNPAGASPHEQLRLAARGLEG
jgi:hypothetical protein